MSTLKVGLIGAGGISRVHADAWRALVLHTGSEAVETALKTALRATGRTRMVAFEGGYHGTFGLAAAVTHGERFPASRPMRLAVRDAFAPGGGRARSLLSSVPVGSSRP